MFLDAKKVAAPWVRRRRENYWVQEFYMTYIPDAPISEPGNLRRGELLAHGPVKETPASGTAGSAGNRRPNHAGCPPKYASGGPLRDWYSNARKLFLCAVADYLAPADVAGPSPTVATEFNAKR